MKTAFLFVLLVSNMAQAAEAQNGVNTEPAPLNPPSYMNRLTPEQQARVKVFLQRKAAVDALKQQELQQQQQPAQ